MKKSILIVSAVLIAASIKSHAGESTCAGLTTGVYEIQTEKTTVVQPASESWIVENQIGVFQRQNYSNDVVLEVRSPDGSILGSDRGDYVLDGKTHYLSWAPEADNYFVKYNAKCRSGRLVIDQKGSDNNNQMKRVSTYHEKMIVAPTSKQQLSVVIFRVVQSNEGKTIYKARTCLSLKKK